MNCIYLLQANNVSFCLHLKEVLFECPARCPFFAEGIPAHYQEALENQYDIDCLYCTRIKVSQQITIDDLMFYCLLRENFHPFCRMCPFALYKADPKQADENNI